MPINNPVQAGGSPSWGGIDGTLSDQTDLWDVINGVPSLFDGSGGNVLVAQSAVSAESADNALTADLALNTTTAQTAVTADQPTSNITSGNLVSVDDEVNFVDSGVSTTSINSLFDGTGGNVAAAVNAQFAASGANSGETLVVLDGTGGVVGDDGTSVSSYALATTTPIVGAFSGTGTATTSFVVTIGVTMSNTNYVALPVPRNTLSSAVFNVSAKTTTTFTVTYLTGLTGAVAFDWAVLPKP